MKLRIKILLGSLILLAALAAAAIYLVRIEKVTVRGNRIYSEEEARKLLLPRAEGMRTAELFLECRQRKKSNRRFSTTMKFDLLHRFPWNSCCTKKTCSAMYVI